MPVFPAPTLQPPDFYTVYGHSWMQHAFGTRSQAGRADSLLRSALDIEFTNWHNHAVSGSRLSVESPSQAGFARILQTITASTQGVPYVSQGGCTILCFGINDLGFNTDTAQYREAYRLALRMAISRCRMSTLRDDDFVAATGTGVTTYGSGWSNAAGNMEYHSGTTVQQCTTTANSTITITLPTAYDGSPIYISFLANPGVAGGTITFTGTAGVTGTLSTSNIMPSASFNHSPCGRRITTLTSANAGQTIIMNVTQIDAASTVIYDGWWIEAATPPPVLVTNIAKLPAAGYSIYGTPPNDSQVDTWNVVVTDVIAEFDSMVQMIDVDKTMDKVNTPEVFGTDGLHPNELGAAKIADACIAAMKRLRPVLTKYGATASMNPSSNRIGSLFRPMVDSNFYCTDAALGPNGTAYTVVSGDVFATPFMVTDAKMSATQWSIELVTSTVATTMFFGLYDDKDFAGYPQFINANTLATNSGALSLTTGAGVKLSSTTQGNNGYISQPLDPGLYWLVSKYATAGTTTVRSLGGPSYYLPSASSAGAGGVAYNGWKLSGQGTGAPSGRFPTGATPVNNSPMIAIKMTRLGG